MRRPLRGVMVALAASAVLLSGCSGDDRSRQVDGAVIQPGKPGEKAEVLDEAPEIERARANDADVEFVQMMIPHHAQALQMAQLAPDARGSWAVRTMADRIDGAQRPEIVFMAGWLTDQGLDAPTKEQIEGGNIPMGRHGGHGSHGGDVHDMAGMASEAQLEELESSRGKDFDRLFLELMIMHHQGAIEMVDAVVREGADLQVNELATSIAADQTAVIDRMRQLLADL
ncbi:DUF305 domain-containing protein [Aeromicrobium sp.]|uniref:DUF305 domain-containing protein n=1 Tax=Aeromicrobium sp. TaxID=1871063 RepID=UPI003517349C